MRSRHIAACIFNSLRIELRLELSGMSVQGTLARLSGSVDNGRILDRSKRQVEASVQPLHRRCETIDLTTGSIEGSKLLLILYPQALSNPMFMKSIAKTQAEHTEACICDDSLPKGCSRLALVSLHDIS